MHPKEVLENVVDLSMSAVQVSVSTAHILSGTREVQAAATSMASAVEELAASIGEIESSANRSSVAVVESSRLTNEGMQELAELRNGILETGTVFDLVSNKTVDLQKVVSNLGDVVELINRIAKQTNLLALNATIEAARAGVQGKGFAVVASEVKSLSNQTSDATKKIQVQINQLNNSFADVLASVSTAQSNVKKVVGQAEKVSHDFVRINQNSSSISMQVSELAGIISQQQAAIELLAQNMSTVVGKGNMNLEAVDMLAEQADQSVKLIEDWRASLANEDIENKVIYLAQADHLLWKKRLLDMAIGRSQLKAKDLTDHTMCRLGKWYYGLSDQKIKRLPSFTAIDEPHKRVHYHGIEAAKCFEKSDVSGGMLHYNLLDSASKEVVDNLKSLLQRAAMGAEN